MFYSLRALHLRRRRRGNCDGGIMTEPTVSPPAALPEVDGPAAPTLRPWASPKLILASVADAELKHTFPTEGYGTSTS